MNITAYFCDDIREEVGGTHTIVGVYADNAYLPEIPAILGRLSFYVRMHLAPDEHVDEIVTLIKAPGQEEIEVARTSPDVIKDSQKRAAERGLPFAGLRVAVTAAPFSVPEEGIAVVTVRVDGVDHVAGALKFTSNPAAIGASTAST